MNFDYSNPSNGMFEQAFSKIHSLYFSATLPIDPIPAAIPPQPKPLEIIAQPYHTFRLRYRSDYKTNNNRRGVLQSRDNTNYQSPAIRVSLFDSTCLLLC
jgi:hypothetical protein